MSQVPEPVTFDCGCKVEGMVIDGVNTMVVTACPLGEKCQVVQIALSETEAQGKPSTVVDAS